MERQLVKISRFLSYVLRHQPESQGVSMDENGWVLIDDLLAKDGAVARGLSRAVLEQIVAENDKQRFEIDSNGIKIRARQGHSQPIELGLSEVCPPQCLYHGTPSRALASIRKSGLLRGRRHHVHLSSDAVTAETVGARHGRPVVLVIRAAEMHERGHLFFISGNGVWLSEFVPPEYIDFPHSEI